MRWTFFRKYPLPSLVFLAILLRLPSWFVPYYNVDELTNGLFSNFVLDRKIGLGFFLGNAYFLTHYLYTGIFYCFGHFNVKAVHIVHSLWVGGTTLALYGAAKAYAGDRRAGLWAAGLYAVFSISFLSKDFQSALAESFSLLPAAIAAAFYFRALKHDRLAEYAAAGFFAALSVLFKFTTAGIMIGFVFGLLCLGRRLFRPILVLGFAFLIGFFIPLYFYGDPEKGIHFLFAKIASTKASYIGFYQSLTVSYVILKYGFRSLLVALSCVGITAPAIVAVLSTLRHYRSLFNAERARFVALLVWIFFTWLMVAMGKRIFFHYFVSLLVPMTLLASIAYPQLESFIARARMFRESLKNRLYMALLIMACMPPLVFLTDGFLRWSLNEPDVRAVADYVDQHTGPNDTLFVWGFSPHLYVEARRQPATIFFWSDSLAGTSPGSMAMEYASAKRRTLNTLDSFVLDLKGFKDTTGDPSPVRSTDLSWLNENELLDFIDLLEMEPHPGWQQVFKDFFIQPPELIVDTSADNYRNFKQFPLKNYELLRRFVATHYRYETTIGNTVIYRLKKS